jgi:hypothetical protein
VYLDETLTLPAELSSPRIVPFRATFGPSSAALGALVLVATLHRLIDWSTLVSTLQWRLGEHAVRFLSNVQKLKAFFEKP